MHVYLISSLVLLGITGLTWIPKLATTPIGILDIIPTIFKTAQDKIFNLNGNGLSTLAFAFLIFAFLESKSLQNLFTSQQEKWKKSQKPWIIVTILTVFASLLSTNLFWYDEFILLYPLVVPLFLSLGLDTFLALLCFFGGSMAGLLGPVSAQNIMNVANNCVNPHVKSKEYEFKGTSGMDFRIAAWLIFTTIVVVFNIWYCFKIYRKTYSKPSEKLLLENKELPKTKKFKFTGRQKVILGVFSFFVIISALGSINWFAQKINKNIKSNPESKLCDNYPYISNSFAKEDKYETAGEVISDESGVEPIKVAEVIKPKSAREPVWTTFGEWDNLQIASWFVIGGITICLISKQNIAVCLVKSAQKSIPIVFAYLLMTTGVIIAKESGMPGQISKLVLSDKVTTKAGVFALFTVFLGIFLISLFAQGIAPAVFSGFVPALAAISANTLLYGFLIMWLARMMACALSPANGILLTSLETNKISYKEYIKKTWILWLIIFIVTLGLVSYCALFRC